MPIVKKDYKTHFQPIEPLECYLTNENRFTPEKLSYDDSKYEIDLVNELKKYSIDFDQKEGQAREQNQKRLAAFSEKWERFPVNRSGLSSTTPLYNNKLADYQLVWRPMITPEPWVKLASQIELKLKPKEVEDLLKQNSSISKNKDANKVNREKIGTEHKLASVFEAADSDLVQQEKNKSRAKTYYMTHKTEEKPPPIPKSKQTSLSYVEITGTTGKEKLPSFTFHTAATVGKIIIIFGGVRMFEGRTSGWHSLDNFKVKEIDFPFPLKSEILNNPCWLSNEKLYALDTVTNSLQVPKVFGDIPPALCCCSSVVVSNRFVFYYGGFELITKFKGSENGKHYIERDFVVNGRMWVLDVISFRFSELKLKQDIRASLQVPVKLERFAHSMVCNEKIKNPATVLSGMDGYGFKVVELQDEINMYVFGGYSYNTQTKKFSCSNFLWKIRLPYIMSTEGESVKFLPIAYFSCLESLKSGPSPRGFHGSLIVDDSVFEEVDDVSIVNDVFAEKRSDERSENFSMIVHGGTNLSTLFGDTWIYSFKKKTWESFSVSCSEYDYATHLPITGSEFKGEFCIASHNLFLVNKKILFLNGVTRDFLVEELKEAKTKYKNSNHESSQLREIYEICKELCVTGLSQYTMYPVINLPKRRFEFYKSRHTLSLYINYSDAFFPAKIKGFGAIETNLISFDEEKIIKSLSKLNITEMAIKKVLLLLRVNYCLTFKKSMLGSAGVFANKKAYSIGGVMMCSYSRRQELLKIDNKSKFDQVMKAGLATGAMITFVNPLFEQDEVENDYKDTFW